ncbi:MAG TPA: PEGA domain-containing protein [Candidatus Acidoferrum sp.]|nr:PEGA domain-containing protein [Candidatus Acidoferrum sp.]
MNAQRISTLCLMVGATAFLGSVAFGQSPKPGKLKMSVNPKQAYTFVDGKAIGPGNRTIKLDVGTHHVVVANYGYKFVEQEVSLDSNQTVPVDIKLEPVGEAVPGPRGRIQIEVGKLHGATAAAVLLNGKKPAYFVGHVDEFNHNIIWHQELIVPPGTHQVTVTRYGKELWSGPITVAADQRVIVDISNGKEKSKPWPRGSACPSYRPECELPKLTPRFKAGVASATVVVAPVSGSVSATPSKIDCNQNTQLAWVSKETVEADMSGMSPVPTSGEKTISPRQTTVYTLTASGPGGVTTPSTTVEVNPVVQSSLSASPMEIRYRRIGDKIIEQGTTTLTWSSSNSDAASLDPGGSVDASGTKSVTLSPTQSGTGPVDEEFKYTLNATNACGGSETKTVAVRLKGSVEPIPAVQLNSIFFPTDYPTKEDPALGLVRSQQEALTTLATGFKQYLEFDPGAKLSLGGYTDERGADKYNDSLSELRVQRVKDFLVSQGIAPEQIDTAAYGKQKPLDKTTVSDLQTQNPNKPPDKWVRDSHATWLAYNRRVDIVLVPTNAESERFYPNQAADSEILWQKPKPARSTVEGYN